MKNTEEQGKVKKGKRKEKKEESEIIWRRNR